MDFDPSSPVIRLCLEGMRAEAQGDRGSAKALFLKAWEGAAGDIEKFHAAHLLSRCQAEPHERLQWLETALGIAADGSNEALDSALPSLLELIAQCREDLGEAEEAERCREQALRSKTAPSPRGPFFHGTKADLAVGELLKPGGLSNYEGGLRMNHVYFTALVHGAGLAAALAKGDGPERVYVVEPTGPFEDDPNVTDKKFLGNPTRSFRSEAPLRVVGELKDWKRMGDPELREWRAKLAANKGKIIN